MREGKEVQESVLVRFMFVICQIQGCVVGGGGGGGGFAIWLTWIVEFSKL